MKKIVIAVITLVVIAIGVAGYIIYQRQIAPPSPVAQAISIDAAVVFRFNNLSTAWSALSTTPYLEDLSQVDVLHIVFNDAAFLDSLIQHNSDAAYIFSESDVWATIHSVNDEQAYCFYAQLPAVNLRKRVDDLITSLLNDSVNVTSLSHHEVPVKKLTYKENASFYAVHKGVFLYSYSIELIQRSIDQLSNENSVAEDRFFQKALEVAGTKVDGNIFVNFRTVPDFLRVFFKEELKQNYGHISEFGAWAGVDLSIKEDGLMLNGFSFSNDTAGHYLNIFTKQAPQTVEFPAILPDNTASFLFFGVENVITFYADYQEDLDRKGRLEEYREQIRQINEEYGIDVELDLLSWIGHEMGVAIVEPSSTTFANEAYAVLRASNIESTKRTLDGLVESLEAKSGVKGENETYNNHTIKYIALPKILPRLFGSAFEQMQESYYTIIGDYVVFGNNVAAIKEFINSYLSDKTLSKDLYYSSFSENLSDQFNIFLYSNFSKSKNIYKSYTNQSAAELLDEQKDLFNNFEALSVQISANSGSFYNNAYIKYNPLRETSSKSSLEARLDTTFSGAPTIFVNHYSDENEIFVQDDANAIYLLNNTGQVLWKKELPEKIMGEVHQVDVYKNNKFQLFFNTKNYLYLVDRNGDDVDNFPVKLKSPATCPVAVFDYVKNKDYRFVIGCEDLEVYNYDKSGKEVKGWKFKKSRAEFRHPFQHVLISGKDYIVNYDVDGRLYGVDRRGKTRMKFNDNIGFSPNNPLSLWKTADPKTSDIIATDTTGKIYQISFSGKVETFKLQEFTAKHHFKVLDFHGDKKPEYIFFDLNQLSIFNEDRTLAYKIRFDDQIKYKPLFFQYPDSSWKIGIVSDLTDEIFLYNSNGSLVDGFPMKGNTLFDISVINSKQSLVLATGTEENIISIYPIQ